MKTANYNYVISVIIADDHELIRNGFKDLFKKEPQLKIVAMAANGEELIKAVREHLPQVVFTDIRMPVMDGIEAAELIKAEFPKIKIIGLSNYDEEELITDMITAGADGYLLKNASKEELIKAIQTVVSGKIYYCPATSQKLLNHLNNNLSKVVEPIAFTNREIEIMKLIAQGNSSKEIAKRLCISTRTVETHRHSLQKKIGTNSVAGIAVYATRGGYV